MVSATFVVDTVFYTDTFYLDSGFRRGESGERQFINIEGADYAYCPDYQPPDYLPVEASHRRQRQVERRNPADKGRVEESKYDPHDKARDSSRR